MDGYNSHILTQVIRFCLKNKIILLYLLSHFTHFLQPLDISIFKVVASEYKRQIALKYSFRRTYNIDKCDFLKIWHNMHDIMITVENIQSV